MQSMTIFNSGLHNYRDKWVYGFAGFMPIYWFSRAVIHLLVLMVETTAFTTRKAVYYTVGTRVSGHS